MTKIILSILEIIGTIAFSISGAFTAIKVCFDIFGVLVIGCVASVGGGILRDILIGTTPPSIFYRLHIILIASLTALTVFLIAYRQRSKFNDTIQKIEQINNIFDAIGLSAFTVMGTELAFTNGISNNMFLSVVLGVLTGAGGGLMRDILTETPPYIFKKHVYAVAAISGSILYYGMRILLKSTLFPSCLTIFLIIMLRMLATKYHWSLPKINLENNE